MGTSIILLLRMIFKSTIVKIIKKNHSLFYSRRSAMPQSGQFLHYRSNSLYYNEKVRIKKHAKRINLQVQIFQTKNIMSISLFARELLQLKNPLKIRLPDFFTIYVCAYYFLTNEDI